MVKKFLKRKWGISVPISLTAKETRRGNLDAHSNGNWQGIQESKLPVTVISDPDKGIITDGD